MSQFQDPSFGSPFSPLRHSLIGRGTPAPLDLNNPSQQLQAAQNLAVARRQPAGAAMPPGGGRAAGPLADSVGKAKSLVMSSLMGDMSGLSKDEQDQLKELQADPTVPFQQFHQIVQGLKSRPVQHNFSGQAAPTDPNAGTIDIGRGHGPNAMSADQMAQWGNTIKQHGLTGGESINQTANGFQVHGAREAGPAQQSDPIVDLIASMKGHVPDQQLQQLQAYAQTGANGHQIMAVAQQMMGAVTRQDTTQAHQQTVQANQQKRQAKTDRTALEKAHPEVDYQGPPSQFNTPDKFGGVSIEQGSADAYARDFQLKQQEQGQQPAHQQHGQYQVGQTIQTPKGAVKIVGLDQDGHPLIEPLH